MQAVHYSVQPCVQRRCILSALDALISIIYNDDSVGKQSHQRFYIQHSSAEELRCLIPVDLSHTFPFPKTAAEEEDKGGVQRGWRCHQSDRPVCTPVSTDPTWESLQVLLKMGRNFLLINSIFWGETPAELLLQWSQKSGIRRHTLCIYISLQICLEWSCVCACVINLALSSSACFHGYQW